MLRPGVRMGYSRGMDKDIETLAREISRFNAEWFGFDVPEEPEENEYDLARHLIALFGKKKKK